MSDNKITEADLYVLLNAPMYGGTGIRIPQPRKPEECSDSSP